MAETAKAETGIALPEGVADNIVNIGVARVPQKKSFIETGMYAANILITMSAMLANALQGDKFSAKFTDLCSAVPSEYCFSSISVNKKGHVEIKISHANRYSPSERCSKGYNFRYDLAVIPGKSRITVSPYLERTFWGDYEYKSYSPEIFFQRLEQMAAQYNTVEAGTALHIFDDFCTLPERLSSVLIPIRENHEMVQKAAEEYYKRLQGLEERLLR